MPSSTLWSSSKWKKTPEALINLMLSFCRLFSTVGKLKNSLIVFMPFCFEIFAILTADSTLITLDNPKFLKVELLLK